MAYYTQIVCLPLKSNIPEGNKDWKLVKCSKCGKECWESSIAKKLIGCKNVIGLCTECALREGVDIG